MYSPFRGHKTIHFLRELLSYSVFSRELHTMSARGYEEAVAQLNKLQSNAQAIRHAVENRHVTAPLIYTKASNYLHALGIEQKQLSAMRIIHVSGTKGKGSVCAYTESILRAYGYRTGFYSSPHLVAVRERIRINGKPISKELFAKYFWESYDLLENFEKRSPGERIPFYFAFLTMMAFRVFMCEKVHVAVIEVGIGGEYDWTNVVDQPSVVGITSLSLDHTKILGQTIEQIAWHKGGIMKFLTPAFTVNHVTEAMDVLKKKAVERRCHLYTVPSLQFYDTDGRTIRLGIAGKVQYENASLAVQMAHFWIKKNDALRYPQVDWGVTFRDDMWQFSYSETDCTLARPFVLPRETIEGLSSCRWPGRCQVLKQGQCTYYLDGAHTYESMEECGRWFEENLECSNLKVLVFHCTGDRDAEVLLNCLSDIDFDVAIFTPTRISLKNSLSGDNTNLTGDTELELQKCSDDRSIFTKLRRRRGVITTIVTSCVEEALEKIDEMTEKQRRATLRQQKNSE